jgi:hypothetical protein
LICNWPTADISIRALAQTPNALQEQLQRQLNDLKAREKAAKKAKGAVVALPLNVTSPQELPTRRHNMHRYM